MTVLLSIVNSLDGSITCAWALGEALMYKYNINSLTCQGHCLCRNSSFGYMYKDCFPVLSTYTLCLLRCTQPCIKPAYFVYISSFLFMHD